MTNDEARKLLSEALLLAENGERPPGAPNDPQAETWADWFRRVEAFLRAEPCRAVAVFWPDDEACDAECRLPAGHAPADEHEDEILGRWTEDELPTTRPHA